MSTIDPVLAMIAGELKHRFSSHTAVLYGSRAHGDVLPSSDYDVAGFAPIESVIRDARKCNGVYLDLFVYPDTLVENPDESLLKLQGGMVLFERDGSGSRLLQQIDRLEQQPPTPLPPDEIEARVVWASKMLERSERRDIEGNYRRSWLLTALVEDYFLIRGRRYPGPKRAFSWLQMNDLPFFNAYQQALLPHSSDDDLKTLVRLFSQSDRTIVSNE